MGMYSYNDVFHYWTIKVRSEMGKSFPVETLITFLGDKHRGIVSKARNCLKLTINVIELLVDGECYCQRYEYKCYTVLQRAYHACIKCQYETSASTVYSISKVCTFRLYHSLHSVQDCLWAKFRVPHVLNAKWSISFAKCKYLKLLT